MAVRRRDTLLVFAPILIGGTFLAYAIASTSIDSRAKEAAAVAAGFVDSSEQETAKTVGFTEGGAYRAKVKADAERLAAEEVQRQKLWDADAPARAKIAAAAVAADAERQKTLRRIEAETAARLAEERRNPAERMTMPNFSWKAGGFGSVGMVTLTIQNGNDFAVKDIGIVCNFSGKSGTELTARANVIWDTIPAKAKKTFKDFNIGLIDSQSARARCQVLSAMRAK